MLCGMSDKPAAPGRRLRERAAEEIRVILARRRMSAAELARRTGIRQQNLSRRMTGETAFDLDDLEVIANALDIRVEDLLRGESPGVQATRECLSMAVHPMNAPPARLTVDRPRDSRPNGRGGESASSASIRRPVRRNSTSSRPASLSLRKRTMTHDD